MRAQCPHCGFEGNIRDDLIPEVGRTIACPKCARTFFVGKGGSLPGAAPPRGAGIDRARPAVTAPPPPPSPPRPAPRKMSPLVTVLIGLLIAALGFYSGYQYRGFMDDTTAPATKIEKPKKAPKTPKPGTMTKLDPRLLMTPMGTPVTGIPPDGAGKPKEPGSGKTFTAAALFETLSAMPPGQAGKFCRDNSTAEVTGDGTLREITKTNTTGSIIGAYTVTVECGADTWVVIDSKMTESYRPNFAVGGTVGFIGTLADCSVSGTRTTIRLSDGMIVIK